MNSMLDLLEFRVHEASEMLYENGVARNDRHTYSVRYLLMPCYVVPLDFTYKIPKFKDEIIMNFNTVIVEH